eukprot:6027932-Pleurochrysis_carterae.AAC.3
MVNAEAANTQAIINGSVWAYNKEYCKARKDRINQGSCADTDPKYDFDVTSKSFSDTKDKRCESAMSKTILVGAKIFVNTSTNHSQKPQTNPSRRLRPIPYTVKALAPSICCACTSPRDARPRLLLRLRRGLEPARPRRSRTHG